MSEDRPKYKVEKFKIILPESGFKFLLVNVSGGSSHFDTLVDLVAYVCGCPDEPAKAAVTVLGKIGHRITTRIKMETTVKEWQDMDRCNGRTQDRSGAIYVVHTAGKNCPFHGVHADPAKRLTKYIGVKEKKVAAAVAAIANHEAWRKAVKDFNMAKQNADSLSWRMTSMAQRSW